MKSQHQQRVEEFMLRAGQDVPSKPTLPDAATRLARAKLIVEEMMETIEALGCDLVLDWAKERLVACLSDRHKPDLIKIIDGCTDTIVVSTGTLSACGVPDTPFRIEVDAANLRKFSGDARREREVGQADRVRWSRHRGSLEATGGPMSSQQHSAKARVKKPAKRRNRRTRRVWVSRDDGVDPRYDIWSIKPEIGEDSGCYWAEGCDLASMGHCQKWFEKLTGIKLKPGECRQFDMLVTMTPVCKKGAK